MINAVYLDAKFDGAALDLCAVMVRIDRIDVGDAVQVRQLCGERVAREVRMQGCREGERAGVVIGDAHIDGDGVSIR